MLGAWVELSLTCVKFPEVCHDRVRLWQTLPVLLAWLAFIRLSVVIPMKCLKNTEAEVRDWREIKSGTIWSMELGFMMGRIKKMKNREREKGY